MARAHWGSTPRGGYVTIFLTEQETREISEDAARVGSVVAAAIPEPHTAAAVTGLGLLLKWKARSCLRHDKCLAVTVAGVLGFPHCYTPGVDDIPPTPHGSWS